LGEEYPLFYKVILPGLKGMMTPIGGCYNWIETDGSKREKYLYSTPIGDSVLGISATTYIDEFTQPMLDLKSTAQAISREARWINILIVGGSMLIIGLVVVGYSYSLSGGELSPLQPSPTRSVWANWTWRSTPAQRMKSAIWPRRFCA
jgi:hypothetical protein